MLLALKVFAKSIIYPLFIYTSYRQRFQNPDIIKVILWRINFILKHIKTIEGDSNYEIIN